jgi:hypothetical protein
MYQYYTQHVLYSLRKDTLVCFAKYTLTLSLLMPYIYIYIYIYIYGAPSKARNVTCIYERDFLLGILLLEPCISLIDMYA